MAFIKATSPIENTHLRGIALTVDEDDPGKFFWAFHESTGDAVVVDKEVAHGEHCHTSYGKALDEGFIALKRWPPASSITAAGPGRSRGR